MNVVLSFDVEIWCNGWDDLDQRFPAAYARYVYGSSPAGDYALPKTLEMLSRHGLRGVFFVEPLFSARFGAEHLARIVALIRAAGQDVQLHLHPEWVDEIAPALIPDNATKRQHLSHYTLAEQTALIGHGRRLLQAAGAPAPTAFRAGSYACNRDTFRALHANGIAIDSSLNRHYAVSGSDLTPQQREAAAPRIDGVDCHPVSTFIDGFGRSRPAQLAGCGAGELCDAIEAAAAAGQTEFVVVSHNFEMLKVHSSAPDGIVVRRFEQLCSWLAPRREALPTATYSHRADVPAAISAAAAALPRTGVLPTLRRHAEQLRRRF